MLPSSHDLLFATASQTIWHESRHGRPTSVTSVQVWEDKDSDEITAESATTGSPAVETNASTTVDAASGAEQANTKKLNVAATTGFTVGRHVLVTNAALGQSEWIEVAGVASADYLLTRQPMVHNYTTSDTVVGTRMSATIDTTWASDKNNLSDPYAPNPRWRAVFTYPVASVVYREPVYFDLLRYPVTFGVTALDVDRESPGWLERLPIDQQVGQGVQLIAQAVRQVKRDLSRAKRSDWAQRNSEQFNDLICMQAVVKGAHAAYMHGGESRDRLDEARRDYQSFFDQWVANATAPEQASAAGDGAVMPLRRQEIFER
jgi:hypothetical protein